MNFLVSTHLVDEVAHLSGEVIVLSNGRAVFIGTPEELERRGNAQVVGDTAMERGYSAALAPSTTEGGQ